MHSSWKTEFQTQTRKRHQNQFIKEITSSQTTQSCQHPILVLASFDDTIFSKTIIRHWTKKTLYITSCNHSEKEKEEGVKVITYFLLDYFPDPNLATESPTRSLRTHKQQAHSRQTRVSLTLRLFHLKFLEIYLMTLTAPSTRPQIGLHRRNLI